MEDIFTVLDNIDIRLCSIDVKTLSKREAIAKDVLAAQISANATALAAGYPPLTKEDMIASSVELADMLLAKLAESEE